MTTGIILPVIAGIVALQIVLWLVLLLWLRRRLRAARAELERRCSETGQAIVLGPASANYRGADFRYGHVRGNGILCATDRAILFERAIGNRIEIPLPEVREITVATSFRGRVSLGAGARHLVLHVRDGNRIGFLLRDASAWKERLSRVLSG